MVAGLQANVPDTFKWWLYGAIQDIGEQGVTELLLNPVYLVNTRRSEDLNELSILAFEAFAFMSPHSTTCWMAVIMTFSLIRFSKPMRFCWLDADELSS